MNTKKSPAPSSAALILNAEGLELKPWVRALRWSLMGSAAALALGACTVVEPPARMYSDLPQPSANYGVPAVAQPVPDPAVSVYVEPPLVQPAPLLVPWAPPPLLVQAPPPQPYFGAVWVGGYWAWHARWVWSAGYWSAPPNPGYVWTNPYYEHRGGAVVFVNGFWAAPGVQFAPPPMGLNLSLSFALPGISGTVAIGPQGVFVPAPPGSVAGIIVPAPLGTAPAVLTGAPAVVNSGMRIVNSNNTTVNKTVVNNITNNITNNYYNTNNSTNTRNVIVQAPASATATHQAFASSVPAQAALAAAAHPMTHWQAPMPQTQQHFNLAALNANPRTAAASLPPPQVVHNLPVAMHAAPVPQVQQKPAYTAPAARPEMARPAAVMAPAAQARPQTGGMIQSQWATGAGHAQAAPPRSEEQAREPQQMQREQWMPYGQQQPSPVRAASPHAAPPAVQEASTVRIMQENQRRLNAPQRPPAPAKAAAPKPEKPAAKAVEKGQEHESHEGHEPQQPRY